MIFLKDTRFDAQISPSASGEAHGSTGIIVSVVVSRLRERDNGKKHKDSYTIESLHLQRGHAIARH